MRVLVTGGTGFIGRALVEKLTAVGHEVRLLTRRDLPAPDQPLPPSILFGVDAIVNMAGESIAGGRWTKAYKQKLRDSRIVLTQKLADACVAAVAANTAAPAVFVNFSAVGYYGTHPTADFTESSPPGTSWLATVARDWETAAGLVCKVGVRLVVLRLGVVLGPGGFLERLALPFRCFVGGPAGTGRQWISWIHRDDVIAAVTRAIADPEMTGAYNLVAPQAATMNEMAAAIGTALNRPSWLRTPELPLKLLFGEMADELILNGQRVAPRRLQQMGYAFSQPELRAAVKKSLIKEK